MARHPLILIPPSEGKAAGGRAASGPDSFGSALGAARSSVLDELGRVLAAKRGPSPAAVLGVRGELLERALVATAQLIAGTAPVLPAWKRYTGVVWGGLEPGSMSLAERRRVLVPSGLYGMTTAADPVADYRLKLLVVLGRLGRLSTYWRQDLTAALTERARGRVVIDMLPAEHAHAIDFDQVALATRVVRVRFQSADGARAVGHEAKSAKGQLARLLIDEGLDGVDRFRFEGWRAAFEGDVVTAIAPKR